MQNLLTLHLKNLPSPLPLSSATKARIQTGSFSESIILGFYASVSTGHSFPPTIPGSLENRVTGCHGLSGSFLGGGQQKPQPSKLQSDQDNAIEAPSKMLYLEQNVDSFEGVCDTYWARRQARDRGPSINTKDIKGLSTGSLFSPAREGTDRTEGVG